jgi:hypothetical protein
VKGAIHKLKNSTGKELILLQLNLANLKSVKAAAEEFPSRFTLHYLTNKTVTDVSCSKEPLLNVLFNAWIRC